MSVQFTDMAVEGGNDVGSISSMLLSSSDLKQSEDNLSREDFAWVDSCLTQDPEILESGWGSLKQALLETLERSAAESYNDQIQDNEVDTIMSTSAEESEITKFSRTADDGNLIHLKGSANSPIDESLGTQSSVGRPFSSDYQEVLDGSGLQESVNMSSGFNLGTINNEATGENVFNIWKLGTKGEEDSDLMKPFLTDKADRGSEKSPIDESLGALSSVRGPFLPNYKDLLDGGRLQESATMSSRVNLGTIDTEPTGEDIFKVWKLEAREEEDSDLINPSLKGEADKESENSPVESFGAQSSVRSPFLPNYREFVDGGVEENVNMRSGCIDNEPTGEEIFKVWEMETPEEEDEFTKELKKALAASEESFQESSPSHSEDCSGQQWKDRNEDYIHGLIAGITDLSLG